MIDEQTDAAVKSDGFATIERSLLEALVERDTVSIGEVELFKAIVDWAKTESERRGIVADGKEIRRILGERIIKAMRFPMMTQKQFTAVVFDSKILTFEEVTDTMKCFNSLQNSPVGSPVRKRSGPAIRSCRFGSVEFGWRNGTSRLILCISHDILFPGVYLFGSKGSGYSVSLLLLSDSQSHVLASRVGKYSSLPRASREYHGFDLLFEEPIFLR